jgi:hypothetical protein
MPGPEVTVRKLQKKMWGSTLLDRQDAGRSQTDPVPVMTSAVLVFSLSYALRYDLSFARSSISTTGSFLRAPTLETLL